MQTGMMPAPRHQFYVTAIDGSPRQGRVYFLAGPYQTREDAERAVRAVQDIACDHARNSTAGRAWFMAYGVSRWSGPERTTPLGQYIPEPCHT